MSRYRGVFWVLVTPFGPDGAVDVAAVRRLVEFGIGEGVAGLTALGVTSEAAHLAEGERSLIVRTVVEAAAGAVPVVIGVSDPCTETAAARAAASERAGVDAVMVAVPPDPARLAEHLAGVAEAAPGLEIILQDYPASGHPQIGVEELLRAVGQVPAVVALKAEDPPTPAKIARVTEGRPGFPQLGGLGGLWLLWELKAGAAGTMTGFAVPEALVAITAAAARGDWDEAARLHEVALPLLAWEAQPAAGLSLRKALLAERGLIATAGLRAQAPRLSGVEAEARALLARYQTGRAA